MSRVVQLRGTYAERHEIVGAITEGLFHLQSGSNYGCYTKRQWYPDVSESDVIVVHGKSRVFDRLPDEPRDEFSTDAYWSSDYVVVLEKPDTELFNLSRTVPTYPAEAGMAHGFTAIAVIVAAFCITGGVSLLFKQGWWSGVYGLVVVAAIIVAYMLEFRAMAFIAGIRGRLYVYNAVGDGLGSREHYKELVTHLSKADHYVVAAVNKEILRWL